MLNRYAIALYPQDLIAVMKIEISRESGELAVQRI